MLLYLCPALPLMLAWSLSSPCTPLHQFKHSTAFSQGAHWLSSGKAGPFLGIGVPHSIMSLSGLLALGLQGVWFIYLIV